MGKEFSIEPKDVAPVDTKFRRIQTKLPAPQSVATLEALRKIEPISMRGQPPVVWDRAEDVHVYDKYGIKWLDWSSGVLVTNAGHGVPEVRQAIIEAVEKGAWKVLDRKEELSEHLGEKYRIGPKGTVIVAD